MFFRKNENDNPITREDFNKLQNLLNVHQVYLNNIFVYYNLKPTPFLENFRNLSYELLMLFSNICLKNDLSYWLDFGTLLGAVRHNDFIPWDDNLNIGMLNKNYIKLNEILESELNNFENIEIEVGDLIYISYFCRDIDEKIITLSVCPYTQKDSQIFALDNSFEIDDVFPLTTMKFGKYDFKVPLNSYEYVINIYGKRFIKIPVKKQKYDHLAYLSQLDDINNILNNAFMNIKKINDDYGI